LEQGEALEARRYEGGTFHRVDDVGTVDEIDLQAPYRAADLINTIRARTFPPYPGSYFRDERGRRVFVRIQLETEGTSQDE
jgi:methionyl-tRNA formyltransferase